MALESSLLMTSTVTGIAHNSTVTIINSVLWKLCLWQNVMSFELILRVAPLTKWCLRFVTNCPTLKSWIVAVLKVTVATASKAHISTMF